MDEFNMISAITIDRKSAEPNTIAVVIRSVC